MKKAFIICIGILLCLCTVFTVVWAAGKAITPSEEASLPYRIAPSDFTALTEKGLLAAYERAGRILDEHNSIAFASVPFEEGRLETVRNAAEQGIPFAANAFRMNVGFSGVSATVKQDQRGSAVLTWEESAAKSADSRAVLQYFIFLVILDECLPDDAVYYTPSRYFDDPSAYYNQNWVGDDSLILSSTYRTHGYDSISEYNSAIRNGKLKNAGDCFVVSLLHPHVKLAGQPSLGGNLLGE